MRKSIAGLLSTLSLLLMVGATIGLASAATGQAPVPVINGFTPPEGAFATQVDITGSDLGNTTSVTFGGTPATQFTIDSGTELTARVPTGAASGPIAVVTPDGTATSSQTFAFIPLRHVVVIDMENHSFNDMLGKFCVDQAAGLIIRNGRNDGCDGTDVGKLQDGSSIQLQSEPDGGLVLGHSVVGQQQAVDGGKMDGFAHVTGCAATDSPPYGCFTQYDPIGGPCGASGNQTCIPNIVQWATSYAVSDRTFEFRQTPSWAGHMVLGDATIQRFYGTIPKQKAFPLSSYPGWGCDSGLLTLWVNPDQTMSEVPPCVPDASGSMGPLWDGTSYASGPHAEYTPTIFDRLSAAGRSWRIYGGGGPIRNGKIHGGYGWAICPTFWSCLGSSEAKNFVANTRFAKDATAGTLPDVSFVTPTGGLAMHQPSLASDGDTWLEQGVLGPLMQGPDWSSTAVFLTWDDCGCFYDRVPPPSPEWGVRVPMIMISPYAKAGYTDSQPTTFVSTLTFIEHTFGIQPLNPCATVSSWDPSCTDDLVGLSGATAYDYMGSFDFSQAPLPPTPPHHAVPSNYDRLHRSLWAKQADEPT